MTWSWLFIPVMVLAIMLVGIVAILAVRAHPSIRAAASASALSAAAIPVSIFLHNVLSASIGDDEAISFVVALLVAPAAFTIAASLVARQLGTERPGALARGFAVAATGVALMVLYMVFAVAITSVIEGAPPYQVEAVVLPIAALVTSAGAVTAAIGLARENALFA